MTMNRHEPFEELISASLRGDLTADERLRLDAHLDGCAQCRATLASFSDQRRIMAGLRHVPPPADLGARVRTGIEGGSTLGLPWWRRPVAIFAGAGGGLAVVAGAILAFVLLNGTADDRPVGEATPTPSTSVASSDSPVPTLPAPSATPVESAVPPPEATPAATPIPASPEPDVFLALTGEIDNQALTVRDGASGQTLFEVGEPSLGPPIAAEMSPDGQWLAYIVQLGESGLNEVRATRIAEPPPLADPEDEPPIDSPVAVGDTIVLGESVAGSPFLEQLFWEPSGRYLAYTLADPGTNTTDAWLFNVQAGRAERLTDVGNAYAGSWAPSDRPSTSVLWVSTAGETPNSYLMSWHHGETDIVGVTPTDPADSPYPAAENTFQPIVSPNGALVIYWEGRMAQAGAEWVFSEGAQPFIAQLEPEITVEAGWSIAFRFENVQPIFTDLTIGREAFASAAIAWGPDSDSFAVWGTQWTGTSQGTNSLYPDESRVYFGHATDPDHITRTHALDRADIPEGLRAIDVKVAPTGRHLVLMVQRPRAGVLDPPRADLLLVTRNTGSVADEVEVIGSGEDGWFGPAAYDDYNEAVAP